MTGEIIGHVILVPRSGTENRELFGPFLGVIGPFATSAAAKEYLEKSQTELECSVLPMLHTIDDPTQDADLLP
jgi:hypothetical protein